MVDWTQPVILKRLSWAHGVQSWEPQNKPVRIVGSLFHSGQVFYVVIITGTATHSDWEYIELFREDGMSKSGYLLIENSLDPEEWI